MGKSGRLVGIILVVVGVLVCVGCSVVSIMLSMSEQSGSVGGAVLGSAIGVVIAIIPVAAGIFLVLKSRSEAAEHADSERQRKVLDIVKTRGQVDIDDLVLELGASRDQVRDDVYKLVGLGVFTGYVNWDKGVLYSKEASQLTGDKCPNCGGQQEFAGKGVIACKYCGTEVFL